MDNPTHLTHSHCYSRDMTNEPPTVESTLLGIEKSLNEGDEFMAELGVLALLELLKKRYDTTN